MSDRYCTLCGETVAEGGSCDRCADASDSDTSYQPLSCPRCAVLHWRAERAEEQRDRARAWIVETMEEGEWAADPDAALSDDPPQRGDR